MHRRPEELLQHRAVERLTKPFARGVPTRVLRCSMSLSARLRPGRPPGPGSRRRLRRPSRRSTRPWPSWNATRAAPPRRARAPRRGGGRRRTKRSRSSSRSTRQGGHRRGAGHQPRPRAAGRADRHLARGAGRGRTPGRGPHARHRRGGGGVPGQAVEMFGTGEEVRSASRRAWSARSRSASGSRSARRRGGHGAPDRGRSGGVRAGSAQKR